MNLCGYVHTSLARYYEEGMRLPPGTGRVDHVNDRFWKDRDLVCEVFRREYGFDDDAELPDDLLAKFHSLWRVDLMGNDVEYSLEALVVRPLTFHYRWRPRPTVPSPRTRTRAVAAPRAARRPGAPTPPPQVESRGLHQRRRGGPAVLRGQALPVRYGVDRARRPSLHIARAVRPLRALDLRA